MCSFYNVIHIISIIKTVSPPLTFVPKIIITDTRSLLSLCKLLKFFTFLVYKLHPIVANGVKHVSPTLHSFEILYFSLSTILPKFCQYFIVGMSLIETIINVSNDLDNSIIHRLCQNWWPFAQTMDSCISQISWNTDYGFNRWHAYYKILAKFGKYYG